MGFAAKVLILLVAFMGGFPALARSAGNEGAPQLDSAARLAAKQSSVIHADMAFCIAQSQSDAFGFRLADYVWHEDNGDVIAAAEQIIGPWKASGQPDTDLVKHPEGCAELARSIDAGKLSFKRQNPEAYEVLVDYFRARPSLADGWERLRLEGGCVKTYAMRGGRDFEAMMATCSCVAGAIGALSSSERKDFYAHSSDAAYINHAPWFSRLKAAGASCPRAP